MAAQKGLDMLIKVSDDGTSGGTLNTVGGIRSTSFSLGAEQVDTTTADSTNRFRELLEGAGVRSVSVSGSGVFKDDAVDEDLRGHFVAGTHAYIQLTIPNFYTIAGEFHIGSLEYSGDHDGEVAFSISLESSGDMTFAAI